MITKVVLFITYSFAQMRIHAINLAKNKKCATASDDAYRMHSFACRDAIFLDNS